MENENNNSIARSSLNVGSNPINETARANEVKKFTSPVNIHLHSLRHRLKMNNYMKVNLSRERQERVDILRARQRILEKKHHHVLYQMSIDKIVTLQEKKVLLEWNRIIEEIYKIYSPYFGGDGKGKGARKDYYVGSSN